jgi:hypothetical protein
MPRTTGINQLFGPACAKGRGANMAKDFDAEIKSIAATRQSAVDARKKAQADFQAAAAAFSKAWNECHNKVIRPALNEIVAKLTAQKIGASTGELRGGGISLIVPMPGMPRNVRVRQHAQLIITPVLGGHHVTFGMPGTQPQNYKVEEITKEMIERHVLELVRKVYNP